VNLAQVTIEPCAFSIVWTNLLMVGGGKNYFRVNKINIEDFVHWLVDLLAFRCIHVPMTDRFVITAWYHRFLAPVELASIDDIFVSEIIKYGPIGLSPKQSNLVLISWTCNYVFIIQACTDICYNSFKCWCHECLLFSKIICLPNFYEAVPTASID
jgi:hypothetical protein